MSDGTGRGYVGIMAKAPRPGHAKTRLTRQLSPQAAAELYRHFLLDTIEVVRRIHGITPALVCPGGDGDELRRLATGLPVVEQPEPGLMHGLAYGIEHALGLGYTAVALINADSPTLPSALIEEALSTLADHDVALGPTADGGYYLIAAGVPCRELLCGITYPSGETIFDDTLTRARALGLRAATITPWFDVDLPDELRRLASMLRDAPAGVAAHTRRALDALERAGWDAPANARDGV